MCWFRKIITLGCNSNATLSHHPVTHIDCIWGKGGYFIFQSFLFMYAQETRNLPRRKMCFLYCFFLPSRWEQERRKAEQNNIISVTFTSNKKFFKKGTQHINEHKHRLIRHHEILLQRCIYFCWLWLYSNVFWLRVCLCACSQSRIWMRVWYTKRNKASLMEHNTTHTGQCVLFIYKKGNKVHSEKSMLV